MSGQKVGDIGDDKDPTTYLVSQKINENFDHDCFKFHFFIKVRDSIKNYSHQKQLLMAFMMLLGSSETNYAPGRNHS